ncbi:MAG: zf-HC2 domain-containing protein [Acidobacteriota bacterium]|nr:zf-HC2 domain-containing protein [Acidobacteriota bacterium]
MTCRDFADFIMDYLAGELPDDTRADFEQHVSRCPNCHEYLAQYRNTIAAGRLAFADPDDEVPPEVPEDLIKAVLASRKKD